MTTRKIERYGWVPDLPDHRDLLFGVDFTTTVPPSLNLRDHCPPVYDQGQLGSCTANALAAAYEYAEMAAGRPGVTPSRLFVYYYERLIEGSVKTDSGAMLRDGAKVLATYGAPPETDWPYDITKFARKPPARATKDGQTHQATTYQRVTQTAAGIRQAVAAGFPVAFGFTVYESFESAEVARTGVVPMPSRGESVLGGHAVLLVGYDSAAGIYNVRNSWGPGWGDAGYFTMPAAYVESASLASDFWTITKVEA